MTARYVFWGTEEVGQALGVSARRAREISRGYRDFPIPEVDRPGTRLWRSDHVQTWIDRHGDRKAGRPRKVERRKRQVLARHITEGMGSCGMTADLVADSLRVPVVYIDELIAGTVDESDWPPPTFLRELDRLFDEEHPALALDAAGYEALADAIRALDPDDRSS